MYPLAADGCRGSARRVTLLQISSDDGSRGVELLVCGGLLLVEVAAVVAFPAKSSAGFRPVFIRKFGGF